MKKINGLYNARTVSPNNPTLPITRDLLNLENSYYLGEFRTTTMIDWSAPELLATDNLKPFVGFLVIESPSKDDPEVFETDNLLIHCRQSGGKWYLGIYWTVENRYSLMGVGEINFQTRKIQPINCGNVIQPDMEEAMTGIIGSFTENIIGHITELSRSTFTVSEYEPTTFKFKQTIPAIRRANYRTYTAKLALIDEDRSKTHSINRAKLLSRVCNSWDGIFVNPKLGQGYCQSLFDGVLFSGVESQITDLAIYDKVNINQVPFDNFTVAYTHELENGSKKIHLINCRSVSNGLEVSVFLSSVFKGREDYKIILTEVFLLRPNFTHEHIFPNARDYLPELPQVDRLCNVAGERLQLIEGAKCIIAHFLTALDKYDVQKVTGRFRTVKNGSIRVPPTPENVHFVLDMSKRRSYEITERYHSCGYHVKEHDRIGHWRRLPNSEEKIFIKGIRVNEGKGEEYGRVTKEYKLG